MPASNPQDALPEPRRDAFHHAHVTDIAAGHAIHDTYTGFLPPLLPHLMTSLALNNTQAGLLSTFLQFPSIFQPVIGVLGDRVSLRWIVIIAPALTAILMSMLGWSNSYLLLAVILLAAGLSSAAFHATAPVLAGALSGQEVGKGMGFWMVGGELGRALGPIIIVTTLHFMSLQAASWLMIPGILASFLLALRLRSAPETFQPQENPASWAVMKAILPLFIPLMGLIAARSLMLAALSTYLPTYLTQTGSAIWTAGAALTFVEIAGIAGAYAGGLASDRFGRSRVLAITMLVSSIFLLLFLQLNGGVKLMALIFSGFFALSIAPVIMAIVQETYPHQRSLANGVYMALSFLIRSAATILFGIVGDTVGLSWAFMLSAIVMMLGLPLIRHLPKPPPAS